MPIKNILSAMYAYLKQVCFEEMIFRCVILGAIWYCFSWQAGIIVSAIIYALVHLVQFKWPMAVVSFVLGIVLGWIWFNTYIPMNVVMIVCVHYIAGFVCWALGFTNKWSRKEGVWGKLF